MSWRVHIFEDGDRGDVYVSPLYMGYSACNCVCLVPANREDMAQAVSSCIVNDVSSIGRSYEVLPSVAMRIGTGRGLREG